MLSLLRTGIVTFALKTVALQKRAGSCFSTGKSTGEEIDRQDPWEITLLESRCVCSSTENPSDISGKAPGRTAELKDERPKEIGNSQNKAEEDLLINRGFRNC